MMTDDIALDQRLDGTPKPRARQIAAEQPAAPKFRRGQLVRYADRQGRPQRGRVQGVDAHWPSYSEAGAAPYLVYTVEHPTYRDGRFYCGEDALS